MLEKADVWKTRSFFLGIFESINFTGLFIFDITYS